MGFRGWAGSFSLEHSKLLSSAAFNAGEVGFMRKRAKRVDRSDTGAGDRTEKVAGRKEM